LASLVIITLVGGLVMIWHTYRMDGLLTEIVDRDVAAFLAAESLGTALINQKGFVSYYFLDGDEEWLRQLSEYRRIFTIWLDKTRAISETTDQQAAVDKIEREYRAYVAAKDRVIEHYKGGEREEGATLHRMVRDHFFKIFDLCEAYKRMHKARIRQAKGESQVQARRLRIIAVAGMMMNLMLGMLLVFMLVRQILGPLRRLAREADSDEGGDRPEDEITALSRSVRGLIRNADQTHTELKRSRKHLLQSEKMAMVGQLAAGTAHSIRNPLTSVKMRLFSLSRSIDLSAEQKEDFEVISDEIRHIDTVVQNFLEFSRPPRLKMQRISPSAVVEMAMQLLAYRLTSYGVRVEIRRERPLPDIQADPEQLKEVLVNIIVNACEAMASGGNVVISEEEERREFGADFAVIRLTDNGPGVPESLREQIFQPFFTTKEEGTGLGLSIASRIVEEHGGWLDVTSKEGEGAVFVIMLPVVRKS
jgi:signal transduction histidine kinase